MISEEEVYLMIGYREVELFELRKALGEAQNELNLRRAEQQDNIRVVGGRDRNIEMAPDKQKARAIQGTITELFKSTQETKEIRRSE